MASLSYNLQIFIKEEDLINERGFATGIVKFIYIFMTEMQIAKIKSIIILSLWRVFKVLILTRYHRLISMMLVGMRKKDFF